MSVHCVRSVFSLLRPLARPAVARLGPAGEIWGLRWSSTSQEVEQEESSNKYKYDVPAYTKIQAWDKGNRQLRQLSILMSSKGKRLDGDTLVLEGSRIIRDAVQRGFHPTDIVFSREKLLWELQLPTGSKANLFHIPYSNIKLWTDLTTSPGVMAAFSRSEVEGGVAASSPLPLTLLCDNIRGPDNLGAVLRVAAAAGAARVLLTPGCCNAWAPKVVRAAAGAHFLLPLVERVGWGDLAAAGMEDEFPLVVLADLQHGREESHGQLDTEASLARLEEEVVQLGEEDKNQLYGDAELAAQYRALPVRTEPYSQFKLPLGYKSTLVVVGGETEGVSDASYMFCHRNNGVKLFVPLRNNVNSLNVISATSLVLFKLQELWLNREV